MDTCIVSGTVYNLDGSLASFAKVYVRRAVKSGTLTVIPLNQFSYTADAQGVVTMELPRGSNVTFWARVTGLDAPEGTVLPIPDAPTAVLEDMVTLTTFPADGMVIESGGVPLPGAYRTLNFSPSFATVSAGASATVSLVPATASVLGGVKAGTGVTVLPDGTLNVPAVSQEIVQDYLATFFNATAPVVATYNDALDRVDLSLSFMPVNPNGVAGGQTINGGTGAGESLTLSSTANAPKGKIFLGASSAYDGATLRLGIETTSPGYGVDIQSAYGTQLGLGKINAAGRIDFRRGSDGALATTLGYSSAGGGSAFSLVVGGGGSTLTLQANATVQINSGTSLPVFFADSFGLVGIGTTAPSANALFASGTSVLHQVNNATSGTAAYVHHRLQNGLVDAAFGIDASTVYLTVTGAIPYRIRSNSIDRLSITSTGLVGVNIAPASVGAQLHVVAKDATTFGQIIQMAATPNGTTGIPFQVWDSTGAPKFTVTTGGAVQAAALSLFSGGLYTNMGGLGYHAGKLTLISTAGVFFSSTTSIDGTQDLSVTRGGVNILQVGDGAANANGTIGAAVHLAGDGSASGMAPTARGLLLMPEVPPAQSLLTPRVRVSRKTSSSRP
jgi:hypothetical protein